MHVDHETDTSTKYTLSSLRRNRELTQKDVFRLTGIPLSTLGGWERAEASPSSDSLIILRKAYQYTGDMLQVWENTKSRYSLEIDDSLLVDDESDG